MITLPQLGYPLNSLEPSLDAKTMEVHYTKHFQTYIDNTNTILSAYPKLEKIPIEKIVQDIDTIQVSDLDRIKLRNNGGGVVNHALYFSLMGPTKDVDQSLVTRISNSFGSIEQFKEKMTTTALQIFGSGWAWLAEDNNKELKLYGLPNQQSPLSIGHMPIIGLDVWEHAYYLKYQNRRAEYITNWWNVLKILP